MSLPPLTEKESRVYDFIEQYFAENTRPPSYEEIRSALGYARISSVQDFLAQLKQKGYLRVPIGANKKRAIELVSKKRISDVEHLPLLGRVAAGLPIEAIESKEYIEVPRSMLTAHGTHFALRVAGQSMRDDAILDGDIVILKKQNSAENGQIVVALIEGEATIKRYYRKKNRVELHPANPEFKVITVDESESFSIEGVLKGLVRRWD
ncbi:MAG: transcriptional repressor LexA [Proteobacteria bacterium]|nr:MAG: transcriptional repressor LexA [Pseudomonadota bacterium]